MFSREHTAADVPRQDGGSRAFELVGWEERDAPGVVRRSVFSRVSDEDITDPAQMAAIAQEAQQAAMWLEADEQGDQHDG